MPRGRKKQQPGVTMLEAYTNELKRLTYLEKDAVSNLELIRQQIQEMKDKIFAEEIKELKEIMSDKNITFDDVKKMLINKTKEDNSTEEGITEDKSEAQEEND